MKGHPPIENKKKPAGAVGAWGHKFLSTMKQDRGVTRARAQKESRRNNQEAPRTPEKDPRSPEKDQQSTNY